VVEVKTGAVADPLARETRRQILEYAWVYGVNEVHLFNADDESLQRVGVPEPSRTARRGHWFVARIATIAFCAGLLVALATVWLRSRWP
jgi:hypothetical protein